MAKRKKEGKPLPETTEMKMWREEFDKLSIDDHNEKLKSLGLDDEDIDEFDEKSKAGVAGQFEEPEEKEEKPKKKKK